MSLIAQSGCKEYKNYYYDKYAYKDCINELLALPDAKLGELLRFLHLFKIPINYSKLAQELLKQKRLYNLCYLAHFGIFTYPNEHIDSDFHALYLETSQHPFFTISSGHELYRINNGELLILQISYEMGRIIKSHRDVWNFFFTGVENTQKVSCNATSYHLSLFISYTSSSLLLKGEFLNLDIYKNQYHPYVISFMIYYGLDLYKHINYLAGLKYTLKSDIVNYTTIYLINRTDQESIQNVKKYLKNYFNDMQNISNYGSKNIMAGFFMPIYTKTGLFFLSRQEYDKLNLFNDVETFSGKLIDMTSTDFTTEDLDNFFDSLKNNFKPSNQIFKDLCGFFCIDTDKI